ncbi:MAG: DUF1616 domain-containing protein [Promethearchaeota archaeon]
MDNREKAKYKEEIEENKKEFDKLVRISLIIGILVVSGIIVIYLFNQEPGFVDFGLLNEDKKAENYPTEASVNEEINFYVYVGNFLGREFTFYLKILKGDNDTELSDKGSKHADLNFTTEDITLSNSEEWISDKLTISFAKEGENQIIIVELWEITKNNGENFFNILYLRLNITA